MSTIELPSLRFQATSLQEKFRFRFFPTRRLQASSNLSSSNVNILKTDNTKLIIIIFLTYFD